MFSDTVKALRLEKRLTLRDFCEQASLDPSNWSKVERGINPPPGDVKTLERLAAFFRLTDYPPEDRANVPTEDLRLGGGRTSVAP